MSNLLDDCLNALASAHSSVALDGLEDRVWTKVQARKSANAAGGIGVRTALTVAALAAGVAFGALQPHPSKPQQVHLSELGVLSEDGLLAPSVRLGGGA
jgi:hypothetical protein